MVIPKQVHAQGDTNESITVAGSNVLLNGQQTSTYYFDGGSSVNFNFSNGTTNDFYLCAKGLSQHITPASGYTLSMTANAESEFSVVLSSVGCSSGTGNPAYLYVDGASGSLSCSVTDGKVWNISGQYSYVPQSIYLYQGSTYVGDIQAVSGSGNYFNANVTEQFSGETSAATYYLYDGTSSSDALIGQATCSAITAAASTSTSSSQTLPQTGPSSTSPSSSSPKTTPSSAKAKTNAVNKQDKTKPTTKNNLKKVSDSNTGLYISSGVILLVIAVLLLLNFLNIWTKPKELLVHVWQKVTRLFHHKPADKAPKTD